MKSFSLVVTSASQQSPTTNTLHFTLTTELKVYIYSGLQFGESPSRPIRARRSIASHLPPGCDVKGNPRPATWVGVQRFWPAARETPGCNGPQAWGAGQGRGGQGSYAHLLGARRPRLARPGGAQGRPVCARVWGMEKEALAPKPV